MPEQKVRIEITGRPEARRGRRSRGAPEKRYGPYDVFSGGLPQSPRGTLVVTLLDLGVEFIALRTPLNETSPIRRFHLLWGQRHQFYAASPDFTENRRTQETNVYKADGLVENTPVVDQGTAVNYRDSFGRWPLPLENSALLGVTLVLGGQGSHDAAAADPRWKERATPQERRDAILEADPGADTTNIDLEIDEWAASGDLDDQSDPDSRQNFWDRFFRDWWRNYAQLRPFRLKKSYSSAWAVDTDAVTYEPFDPYDTENYKVTEGSYEDDEVRPVKLGNAPSLVIGLVPRYWDWQWDRVEWWYQSVVGGPDAGEYLYRRTASTVGVTPGMTTPQTSRGEEDDFPFFDVVGIGQFESDRLAVESSDWVISLNPGFPSEPRWNIAGTVVAGNHDGLPPAAGGDSSERMLWKYAVSHSITAGNTEFSGDIPDFSPFTQDELMIAQSSSEMTIVVRDTVEGDLVGRFRLRGRTYSVYRRTTLPGGALVYEGAAHVGAEERLSLDGSQGTHVVDFDTNDPTELEIGGVQSRSLDFSDLDPGTDFTHVTI